MARTARTGIRSTMAAFLMCAGLGLAGLGLAAAAQAEAGPTAWFPVPADNFTVPHHWCPGQPLPANDVAWDMGICHTWYWVPVGGMGNVGQFVWDGPTPPQPLGPPPCYGAPICLPGL